MLRSTDIAELKSRMKLNNHGLQLIRAFYVKNASDEGYSEVYHNWFENLEDNVREKILNTIRELYSTKIGNNMLSVEFCEGARTKDLLFECSMTKLKQDSSVRELIEKIADNYEHVGNYLVIMAADVYDVPNVNKAGESQEESEEVYQSIAVAICPVSLEIPVLCMNEGSIQSKQRFWTIRKPYTGFICPAFEERTADMDKIMVYVQKPLEMEHDFLENTMETKPVMTRAEIVKAFDGVVDKVAQEDKERKARYLSDINMKLLKIFPEDTREGELNAADILNVAREAHLPSNVPERLEDEFRKAFRRYLPKVADLLNAKYILSAQEMEKTRRRKSLFRRAAEFARKNGNEDLAGKLYQAAGTDSVLSED